MSLCSLHTGRNNRVRQSCESYQTLIIQLGCTAPYEQHTLGSHCASDFTERDDRLQRGKRSAVTPQEDEFKRCERALPLIQLAVAECSGAMRVTGVKSACHRQLNGVLRRPAETPSSEQKCDRKLWMENRAGRLRRRRGLKEERGPADAAFHVVI